MSSRATAVRPRATLMLTCANAYASSSLRPAGASSCAPLRAAELKACIVSGEYGEYQPGQRLPGVNDLMQA